MTVLKIAAGVFLGIFAILVLVKVPDFLREGQNSHAQFAIGRLTPDELISRCGKPASEKRMTGERRLTYQVRAGEVTAVFLGSSKDGWNFNRAKLDDLPVGVWEKDGAAMILSQLSCMDTPKKEADSGR